MIVGVVLSVTIVSASVWCVQITIKRGFYDGFAAGFAISLAQGFWSLVAAELIIFLARWSLYYDWLFRLAAAAILFQMGASVLRADRVKSIHYSGSLSGMMPVFRATLARALTMPGRLTGYSALLISVSMQHLRRQEAIDGLFLGFGALLGSFGWWLYLVLLAALFGHRVSEPITLRSMNKLYRLAGLIFFALVFLCLAPLLEMMIVSR